ncbi:hypothetical protein G6F23_013523 [Rhizopus arrhizus]|nr:hypothetical protein G6F23_013523 [Rhizopus arrhizus]
MASACASRPIGTGLRRLQAVAHVTEFAGQGGHAVGERGQQRFRRIGAGKQLLRGPAPAAGRQPLHAGGCGGCRPVAGTTVTRPAPAATVRGRLRRAARRLPPSPPLPAPPPVRCLPPRRRPAAPLPRHWRRP